MRDQTFKPRRKAANEYRGYFPNKHNRSGLCRVMFIVSAALRQTRSSRPSPRSLPPAGLSWSDLHKPPEVDWKSEALECFLFVVLIACLVFIWLVVPAVLDV